MGWPQASHSSSLLGPPQMLGMLFSGKRPLRSFARMKVRTSRGSVGGLMGYSVTQRPDSPGSRRLEAPSHEAKVQARHSVSPLVSPCALGSQATQSPPQVLRREVVAINASTADS